MTIDHLEQPLLIVIFGITGDLAQRKLLPALYQLAADGALPEKYQILGLSRRDVTIDTVYASVPGHIGADYRAEVIETLRNNTVMQQLDMVDQAAYTTLLSDIQAAEKTLGDNVIRLYYLSIPSQAFTPIVRLLGATGHMNTAGAHAPRLLVEKPFGYDLISAQELMDTLGERFSESQVYKIDHYVAKETVQNILSFRQQNPLFTGVWNTRHIEQITVTAYEQIGIEGRADFYEQTGALRDFVQNHLLQLLAITTMDQPATCTAEAIHTAKEALLDQVVPIAPDEVSTKAVRGQYEGYRQEVANLSSITETFARLYLRIDSDTWRDTAVVLQAGKAMSHKRTEVSIRFRSNPDAVCANELVFRVQPNEGISMRLQIKRPGLDLTPECVEMKFDYTQTFTERSADAYERVIIDAIRGDQTLFASTAEILRSWHIVNNVLEQWSHGGSDLIAYQRSAADPVDSNRNHTP